ncbi:MAG: ATP-dependent DNA helicase RecG [Patescibacteria group bacterium]
MYTFGQVLNLETPLGEIQGIAPRFLKYLERLHIKTVKDLVFHFPFRYEDFSQVYPISELEPGQQATIQGVVEDISVRRSFRKHMIIVEAVIRDDSDSIRAVWFNQPFIRNVLRPGRLANFSGKVSISENEIFLSSPTYELIGKKETAHTGRLVPIYPETRGLTSKGIRYLIQPILKNIDPIPEWIPEEILENHDFPEINDALNAVHFPKNFDEAVEAKNRFAFEDLFLLQLYNARQKLKLAQEKAPVITTDIETLKELLQALPFELTTSQKKSLWEIIQDIGKPSPMNRLLQGDVGSGKTVVAALAALAGAFNGYQTALMAPTEVLARQHYETMKGLLGHIHAGNLTPKLKDFFSSRFPIIGLLTSANAKLFLGEDLESELKKPELNQKITSGEIKILIGTHSLIEKTTAFKNLGVIIIDEQHRFGVAQRAALLNQSAGQKNTLVPHFLSMSATPIPRTLMLTVFGDLDISTINELPSGRKNIVTKIVAPEDREKAYAFIRGEVKKGRQAFVICPRIEREEEGKTFREFQKFELKSVKEEYEKLSKNIFPDLAIGMLHGQMKSKEKEKIMSDFKNKKIHILVSTSVIEVGVDIPNASVMMIEGSDRFGLAQLYQFRGRVGRGEHQSYCLLFTDSDAKTTSKRLKAIIEAKNGFELAEKDLEIRGPGQFFGTEQTGLPDLAMQGLQDMELVKQSGNEALQIIKKDASLTNHPFLKKKLAEFQKKIHQE